MASGTITETEYKEATGSGNAELSSLQDQLIGFQSLQASGSTGESIVRLKKELKQFMKLEELTPEMIHRFVDKIEVQADGSVNIHYMFTATALLTA